MRCGRIPSGPADSLQLLQFAKRIIGKVTAVSPVVPTDIAGRVNFLFLYF
jgi:hypothetical protein